MTQKKQPIAEQSTAPVTGSVFATLSKVNCNEHTEKKNNLTYLSWAWAWSICKSHYPDAAYTIYENPEGRPYFDDGRTAWVKTGVTIQGQEHIEYLPIMDYNNRSIPLLKITSMDMNKAIQRSLTKAIARHGLGLYIYAGEDLPDALDDKTREEVNADIEAEQKKAAVKPVSTPVATKKKPLPARGSDEWNKWVIAAVNGWTSKTGKTAAQVFAATYDAPEDVMQDMLACFEEDIFNFRVDNAIPSTNSTNL